MSLKTPKISASQSPAANPEDQNIRSAPEISAVKKDIRQHRRTRNKGGRPLKMNKQTVSKLVNAFENDFTLQEAWDHAGISKPTYYRHLSEEPGFRDKMRRAQQYPLTLAKRSLFAQIKGNADKPGDGSLSLRLLERRQSDRYKIKIENENPITTPITVILPGQKAHPRFTPPAPPAPPKK